MNKNSKRRIEAARDAFGRCRSAVRKGRPAPTHDVLLSANIGHKPRRYRKPKVGATGPDIARRLGHTINPEHKVMR